MEPKYAVRRTHRQHMEVAVKTWDQIAGFVRSRPKGVKMDPAELETLCQAARANVWLYPLVEGFRGIPR